MLFAIYVSFTLLTIIFAAYMYFWYRKKKTLFKLAEETTGIVTKIVKGSFAVSPEPKGPVYNIKVQYTIDGRNYYTKMQCEDGDKHFTEGQAVTVLYNPEKPSMAIPKDYNHDHAIYYWRMLVILSVILCVLCVCVTAYTAPNALRMSAKTELRYKICVEAFAVVALPVTYFLIRRTDDFKKEKERDPKGSKRNFFAALALWCNFLISLLVNIFLR